MTDALEAFENVELLHGWRVGFQTEYPETVVIDCASCHHLSCRDRDEVKDHVCPGCGNKPLVGRHGLPFPKTWAEYHAACERCTCPPGRLDPSCALLQEKK